MTLDLQTYIHESRAKGMSDDQIRQSLVSAGWQASDIDAALAGQNLSDPNVGQNKKFPKWAIWLIVLIIIGPMIIWGIFLAVGYYGLLKLNQIVPEGIENEVKNSETNRSQKLCGDWPGNDVEIYGNALIPDSQLPSGFASDFPLYPNSKVVGRIKTEGVGVGDRTEGTFYLSDSPVFCSEDNLIAIFNYFQNSKSNWKMSEEFSPEGYPGPVRIDATKNISASDSQGISITLQKSENKTVMIMHYLESRNKD